MTADAPVVGIDWRFKWNSREKVVVIYFDRVFEMFAKIIWSFDSIRKIFWRIYMQKENWHKFETSGLIREFSQKVAWNVDLFQITSQKVKLVELCQNFQEIVKTLWIFCEN